MRLQTIAVLAAACVASTPAVADVARWNRVAVEAAAAHTHPLDESRVLAMVHLAIHDALNAVERRYEPYVGRNARAPSASPDVASAAAAHRILSELLPEGKDAFDAVLAEVLLSERNEPAKGSGLAVGRASATAVLAARANDGAKASVQRAAGRQPGQYRPTPPDFTPAMFAHWGNLKPFALDSAAQFRPAPPPAVSSAKARAELEEVRAIGGKESVARTSEQSEIARFWYENSPQGWNRIARELAVARKLDAWESARLLALVNLAMADGFIAGFEAKYHYGYWRPATAIRESSAERGPDAGWLSYLVTPPVPDYPSTHTVLGAAAATVMARFFGTDYVSFSMTSGAPYGGIARRFHSFSEAAQENGTSRVLAGVHFTSAVRAGYAQGERIGDWTYARALQPVRAD